MEFQEFLWSLRVFEGILLRFWWLSDVSRSLCRIFWGSVITERVHWVCLEAAVVFKDILGVQVGYFTVPGVYRSLSGH